MQPINWGWSNCDMRLMDRFFIAKLHGFDCSVMIDINFLHGVVWSNCTFKQILYHNKSHTALGRLIPMVFDPIDAIKKNTKTKTYCNGPRLSWRSSIPPSSSQDSNTICAPSSCHSTRQICYQPDQGRPFPEKTLTQFSDVQIIPNDPSQQSPGKFLSWWKPTKRPKKLRLQAFKLKNFQGA